MIEEWRPIKGFENYYCVSNTGKIKSLPRIVVNSRSIPHKIRERILKPVFSGRDYHAVTMYNSKENICLKTYIHRIVANAFLPNPENLPQVNHKDGDKANNSVSNLEWVTSSENMTHAINKKLIDNRGESCKTTNLTDEKVIKIRKLAETEIFDFGEIGELFKISRTQVYNIVKRKNWTHI